MIGGDEPDTCRSSRGSARRWVHGHVIVIFMLLCVLELEKVGEPSRRLEYDVITQNDVSKPRHGQKEYDGGGATAMHRQLQLQACNQA